jgi:hypothetical protein
MYAKFGQNNLEIRCHWDKRYGLKRGKNMPIAKVLFTTQKSLLLYITIVAYIQSETEKFIIEKSVGV